MMKIQDFSLCKHCFSKLFLIKYVRKWGHGIKFRLKFRLIFSDLRFWGHDVQNGVVL